MSMLENKETVLNEALELSREEMALATGGTFTINTYRKDMYHLVGISTSYHFFDKDEFMFMGRAITYEQANEIVDIAKTVNKAMNTKQHGANQVGYTENAFIRAFNSQLNLKYGYVWNGKPGYDF